MDKFINMSTDMMNKSITTSINMINMIINMMNMSIDLMNFSFYKIKYFIFFRDIFATNVIAKDPYSDRYYII